MLAGGANRGAYQAGVIVGLAQRAGLKDGEPLDYCFVGGASSGGINAYLTATAQYSMLKDIWPQIAASKVLKLKAQYAPILAPQVNVLMRPLDWTRRFIACIALAVGLIQTERSVVDSQRVRDMFTKYAKPTDPIHIPLYLTTTNMTMERAEIFNRRATTDAGKACQSINDELLSSYDRTEIRPLPDNILPDVFFASAALPVVFDPVIIPRADGTTNEYSDGGLTENLPVDVSRYCADHIQIISCDAGDISQNVKKTYRNAVDIAVGMYETIERRLLHYEFGVVFGEHLGAEKRSTRTTGAEGLRIDYLAPATTLPGRYGDFSDVGAMSGMFEIGKQDGLKGWASLPASVMPDAQPRTL